MKYYLNINKDPNRGEYFQLHKANCEYYQNGNTNNFIYVGHFVSDKVALIMVKIRYPKYAKYIDGCIHCCPTINKK